MQIRFSVVVVVVVVVLVVVVVVFFLSILLLNLSRFLGRIEWRFELRNPISLPITTKLGPAAYRKYQHHQD